MLLSAITSCSKNNTETKNCTLQLNPININFNVVDKNTNQDLYFSSNPRFQTKDLYFFRKTDVARKDTIRPTITGTGVERSFQYTFQYTSFQDSVILHTGNLSDNTISYAVKKTDDVCTQYKVSTVSSNGSTLIPSSGKYIFVK